MKNLINIAKQYVEFSKEIDLKKGQFTLFCGGRADYGKRHELFKIGNTIRVFRSIEGDAFVVDFGEITVSMYSSSIRVPFYITREYIDAITERAEDYLQDLKNRYGKMC